MECNPPVAAACCTAEQAHTSRRREDEGATCRSRLLQLLGRCRASADVRAMEAEGVRGLGVAHTSHGVSRSGDTQSAGAGMGCKRGRPDSGVRPDVRAPGLSFFVCFIFTSSFLVEANLFSLPRLTKQLHMMDQNKEMTTMPFAFCFFYFSHLLLTGLFFSARLLPDAAGVCYMYDMAESYKHASQASSRTRLEWHICLGRVEHALHGGRRRQ